MKIDILCGSGSPDGVHLSDLHGVSGRVGVGGAEYALLTMCEGWTKAGHQVVLYNNPTRQDGVFEQRAVDSFQEGENRDVLIVFREPTSRAFRAAGLRVFWSCDQYTVGDFKHFAQFAQKIVTISPFHTQYFAATYGITNSIDIDLAVRSWEYDNEIEKVPNRLIFTSVPDRGLDIVAKIFPRVRAEIPDASLVITSDYRLWGVGEPRNSQYIQKFIRESNVQFLGAVQRKKLIEEQLKAQMHFYTSIYDELFCISVAESQVAGVLPITTNIGALATTNMGVLINGNANDWAVQNIFIEKTIEYLQNPELPRIQKDLQKKAKERFSLNRILGEWDRLVFNAG